VCARTCVRKRVCVIFTCLILVCFKERIQKDFDKSQAAETTTELQV
jgi:hypothetical protein